MSTLNLARLRTLAVALVLALLAAACGGDDDAAVEEDPTQALRDAVAALDDYEGVEVVMRLDADDAALASIEADDEVAAEALLNSSLLVRASGDTADDSQVEFVVVVDGSEVFELRMLGGTDFFARVDVDPILTLVDDPDAAAEFDAFLDEADVFGLGEVAEAVRTGGWIHLTGVEQMLNMFEGMMPMDPDLDEEEAEELADELTAAIDRFLEEDVSVDYVGSEDTGERVRVTTDGTALRNLLADVIRASGATGAFGEMGTEELLRELDQEVPDDLTLSLDAWLSDGRLSQVAFDVAAVDDEVDGELLLVLGIEEFTGSIDPPDDVTEIDLFGLFGGLLGGLPGEDMFGDDPFGDDAFDDDMFEDDAFEDDAFEDDAFEDDAFEDDAFEDECITEEELDEIAELLGEEAREEFQELIDAGFLEMC